MNIKDSLGDRVSSYQVAIKKIIASANKPLSQEEADTIIRDTGIIDEEGNITPEFQNIFIKREGE